MFYFNEFLVRSGLDPNRVRLLRHDDRGLTAWRQGGPLTFGCFASFQKTRSSPYAGADIACQFIAAPPLPDGTVTALFLGATRILDRWSWDEQRLPVLRDERILATERGRRDVEAFDLEWITDLSVFAERILIRWGSASSARAWSQWGMNEKAIIELRRTAHEPPFPGFSRFRERISTVATLPFAWRAALGSTRGIYLLVSGSGEQYVGSASGNDGFIGRWDAYARNGHGGNTVLQASGYRDYAVSILEVSSPDMARDEIIAREVFWKDKLGSRAHGLNAN